MAHIYLSRFINHLFQRVDAHGIVQQVNVVHDQRAQRADKVGHLFRRDNRRDKHHNKDGERNDRQNQKEYAIFFRKSVE